MTDTSNIPPLDTAALLHEYGLRPNKRLGQNFLRDPNILDRLVQAADLQTDDVVLEVGPGLGSLTRHLATVAEAVVAVELDQRLIEPLGKVLGDYTNVNIVQGDMLTIPPARIIKASGYVVVANIPYYITSALLRHLLEASPRPQRMILTVQQEVAARICVKEKKMSLLALSVQVYGTPSIVGKIPAGAFYPPPKVDSAVIRIDLYPEPVIPSSLLDTFFFLAKAGFSQKRKTLRNALSSGARISPSETENLLNAAEIDPRRRAETLNLTEWARLGRVFSARRGR
ncbi:MAG: 16S rRNA (adenine(1518)-N(6)/adenine(1519)-N(6))-dimethyltransferase RsmA [Anaerolineales bacterium]|nr:16S rRNA (adenine(1518)-N(6)/adenine(1519)-N(6))-dimethyltransferase RsmA [Anaerolineales bacterium]